MTNTLAPGGERLAESRTHRPPAHLRPYVESVVGYRFEGFAPGVHQGLPSQHLTVVFSFDEPLDMIAMADPAQHPVALAALAGGLHAAPVSIRHDGNQHGMQLQVTPLGARALFGIPAAELAWVVVGLDDVLPGAGGLADRLETASSWAERFAVLDDALARRLASAGDHREPRPEVAFAFDRLRAVAGVVEVRSLAREVGWSRRHLAEQFRREYGLAPKTMSRVFRFERARSLVGRPDRPSLAAVAASCGYADQAHMSRDFTELAGASPSAWLADEELPFVQDTG